MSTLLLQHTRSDGEVDTYHLKAVRRYDIGRGSQCEVRILDMKMSRKHCAVEHLDGAWQLIDHGSTNGVRLNGTRITRNTQLHIGCLLQAGTTVLQVHSIDGETEAPAGASSFVESIPEKTMPETSALTRREERSDRLEPQDGNAQSSDDQPVSGIDLDFEDSDSRPALDLDSDSIAANPEPDDSPELGDSPEPVNSPEPSKSPAPSTDTISADDFDFSLDATPANNPVLEETPAPEASKAAEPQGAEQAAAKPTAPAAPVKRQPTAVIKPVTINLDAQAEDDSDEDSDSADSDASSDDGPAVQVMATGPQDSPASDASQEPNIVISLLGQRVGPLPRSQARALKAKELKGQLHEEDLAELPKA